jgi:hypothetical protein
LADAKITFDESRGFELTAFQVAELMELGIIEKRGTK